jgi:hypothetical protein
MLAGMSCAAMVCGAALAVPAQPGDVVNLNGTTLAAEPWLGGVSADGANLIPFTILDSGGNAVFQGAFTSSPSVSGILGTMTVSYRVRDTQAIGDRRVVRVDIFGFTGLQTNVDFRTDGLGTVGPNLASRTNGDGAQISFLFQNPLLSSDLDSRFFYVHSNGTAFTENGLVRIVLNTNESVVIGGVHVPALTDCPSDTNGDGIVNFTDLNRVLSDFGQSCN